MTRTEHLLVILAEECAEVAHRASKALRFGLTETQPGQDKTNAERLIDEVNDFIAVYQMIAGPVAPADSPPGSLFVMTCPDGMMRAIREKQAKIERFLRYSAECGTLAEDSP